MADAQDTSVHTSQMFMAPDPNLKVSAKESIPQPEQEKRAFTWNDASATTQEEQNAMQYRSRRRYVLSRPKVMQYAYKGQIVRSQGCDISNEVDNTFLGIDEPTARSRERLDLFIDLIWVGIISNIAEAYSSKAFASQDGSPSDAFFLYLVVFLPSWRIWNGVREILNNYYRDDLLQRLYIFLLLVLSVYFGNNLAYTTEKPDVAKVTSISLYLFIRASLILCELGYSIFIPWLRRIVLVTFLFYLPSFGLWIAAIYLNGNKAYGAIAAAIAMDYTVPILLNLSTTRKKLLRGYGKALDAQHFTSRMESFYIITIGEGVLQLIRDGPLGIGITRASAYSVWGLLIYFLLTLVYFNRDSSQQYVPAVVRHGWRTWLWITCHIPIFLSVLSLSAGIMYTVRETAAQLDIQTAKTNDEQTPPADLDRVTSIAVWTIAISLAIAVSSMTAMALLDQPKDTEIRLRINNRYFRLGGRPVYVIVVLCIPIAESTSSEVFLTVCASLMALLTTWEYVTSTEHGNKIVEPKQEQ